MRRARTILMTGLILSVAGCFGFTSNPSYFPYLLPHGDITRTHAKPIGKGTYGNFDPHANKLVVRPRSTTNPVRKHLVLLATVYDRNGKPRRGRRVEWMIEGAGNIVEVDESGIFNGRGYKVNNRYAVSHTAMKEHRITRGNDNPNDDIMIRPGQTWCVITSAVEGDTHATVYVPAIHNWKEHKIHYTYHWVNARWDLPPRCSAKAGTKRLLTTKIFSTEDKQPLTGYRVRYRILDKDPNVVFARGRGREKLTVSELDGSANVEVVQLRPQRGSSRVGVEIIRAPDPTSTSGTSIVLGRGECRIDWLDSELNLKMKGPESTALGRDAPYVITLNNVGRVDSKPFTVRATIPKGFEAVKTDPPASKEGDQLIWKLTALPGQKGRDLKITYRTSQPGSITPKATLLAPGTNPIEDQFTTRVTKPGLQLSLTGPKHGAVDTPATFRILVSNPGTGPAENVVIQAGYSAGLEHERGVNPIELELSEPIAAGKSREIPLTLTPRKAGRLKLNVAAKSTGDLIARASASIDVKYPALKLRMQGPKMQNLNRQANFKITIANGGAVPLRQVTIQTLLPEELTFIDASDEGRLTEREVLWRIGDLKAGETKTVTLITRCDRIAPAAKVRARALAEPSPDGVVAVSTKRLEELTESSIAIRGLPAFRLGVRDRDDPVLKGKSTSYRIDVTNQGSLRATGVEIKAVLSKHWRILKASGPSKYKIEGQTVTFEAKDGLEPSAAWSYYIEVEAIEAGDARLKVELDSSMLRSPVRSEQSTTIFAPLE